MLIFQCNSNNFLYSHIKKDSNINQDNKSTRANSYNNSMISNNKKTIENNKQIGSFEKRKEYCKNIKKPNSSSEYWKLQKIEKHRNDEKLNPFKKRTKYSNKLRLQSNNIYIFQYKDIFNNKSSDSSYDLREYNNKFIENMEDNRIFIKTNDINDIPIFDNKFINDIEYTYSTSEYNNNKFILNENK